jgi:hypothetical protein
MPISDDVWVTIHTGTDHAIAFTWVLRSVGCDVPHSKSALMYVMNMHVVRFLPVRSYVRTVYTVTNGMSIPTVTFYLANKTHHICVSLP